MSASINDKLRQVKPNSTSNPTVTTVSSSRSIGGTSLSCVDLTDWATDTAVDLITYKKKSDGTKDFTTQVSWKGIVSSNTIGSLTLVNGTDAGNDAGDYVEAAPTGEWAEGIYGWGTTEHNVDGTHKPPAILDSNGNEVVKFSGTTSAVNEVTIANAATGNGPTISPTGTDTNIDLNLEPKGTGAVKTNGNPVWQYLGSAQRTGSAFTTTSTSYVQVTTLSVTVTIPSGYTAVKITVFAQNLSTSASGTYGVASIWRGTVGSGTKLIETGGFNNNGLSVPSIVYIDTPGAGTYTYNAGVEIAVSTGTLTVSSPAYILVECC